MKLGDTLIEQGGVMRCCMTITHGNQSQEVNLGDKRTCACCKQEFTLVEVKSPMISAYRNPKKPVWKPNWQLKEPK